MQRNRLSADIEPHCITDTRLDCEPHGLWIGDYGNNRILDIGFDEFPENDCSIAGAAATGII